MNAAHEVDRLLSEHQAVLVRQNKHLVYRLPNGQNFVMAKTTSDPARAAKNNLTDLRRLLGIRREQPEPEGVSDMPIEENATSAVAAELAPQPTEQSETLKQRIDAAVARAEQEQEALLAAAQKTERRIQTLKALLPFAEDPATEDLLRVIMPPAEPTTPEPVRAPEPPQQITERVQVTRQLVLAATQTFDETFTVNDVLALMTGGCPIDRAERVRIRSSIAQAIVTLFERGEVIREAEGYGKRQAIWKKAALSRSGNGAGMHP